jgi:guanylate kinase
MQGKLLIFSAPSGSGKTTIVKHLLEVCNNLEFSISACSRAMRPGEVHGKDYYFLSADEFRQRIASNQFVEWEEVYPGSYYGTLKSELERIWAKGNHVLFDVDVKGGVNLKRIFGNQALSVFVQPPSIAELEKRLVARCTETPETLAKRIGKAEEEMAYAPQFDTIIVNDNLEQAFAEAINTVKAFLTA